MRRSLQNPRLVFLVGAHVLLLAGNVGFVVLFGPPSADWFVSWFLAAPFVQVNLLAVWATWAQPTVSRRVPTAMVALAVVSLVLSGFYGGESTGGQMPLWTTALAVQWLALQVPLAALRALLGLRLARPGETRRVAASDVQFSLRELFLWTAAIGVLLGLARWAFAQEGGRSGGVSRGDVIFFGLLLVSNAGLALAATVGALIPRFWTLALSVMTLLAAGFTWEASRVYDRLFGHDDAAIVVWLNAFQFPLLMVSLLAIRNSGYRLARIRPTGPAGRK